MTTKLVTALTCISGLCTCLTHVRTDLGVFSGDGLPHRNKPLHRQAHRLPHPHQSLCGFLCHSRSLLMVYQCCNLFKKQNYCIMFFIYPSLHVPYIIYPSFICAFEMLLEQICYNVIAYSHTCFDAHITSWYI